MKSYEIGASGSIETLRLVERPTPVPRPGEALIHVRASALNRRDIAFIKGFYGARQPENRIPLSDGAGEVVAVGDGVTTVKIGDRVSASNFINWLSGDFMPSFFARDVGITYDGWLSEYIVAPAAGLIQIPDAMDFTTAATFPVAGGTCWQILSAFAGIKAGDIVLTQGTGGVSMFAVKIAKMFGATAAITSSSDAKLELAKAAGADITINYRDIPDWPSAIMAQTGGRGADIVIETGGPASLSQSIAAAAPNARIGLIGSLAGAPDVMPNLFGLVGKNILLKGITSSSRAMLTDLYRAAATNSLQPVIGATFSFGDAPAAYAAMVDSEIVGKIVISH